MSNHSNFPGSGQRLNGSRTMTQQMSPTSSGAPVQSNTDSGGKGNRRFATLDDLKTNSSDGREAPVPIAPGLVECGGNESADQAADQSNHDQRGGDNMEVVMQYGNISLDDNHQIGRNIFDFGGGVENQSTGADEAEAENSESTESSYTGQRLGGTSRSRISTTIKPIPLTSSTATPDYYRTKPSASDRHDAPLPEIPYQSDIPPRWAAVPQGSDLNIDESQGNFNIGNNQKNGASVYINTSGQKESSKRHDPGTPKISANNYRPTVNIGRSQFNLNFGEGQVNEGSRVEF